MTVEMKTAIELSDIKAIEFECANCRTKLVFPVSRFKHPPTNCGHCDAKQWLIPGSVEFEELQRLGQAIQRFANKDTGGFIMRLEITNPSVSHEAGDKD